MADFSFSLPVSPPLKGLWFNSTLTFTWRHVGKPQTPIRIAGPCVRTNAHDWVFPLYKVPREGTNVTCNRNIKQKTVVVLGGGKHLPNVIQSDHILNRILPYSYQNEVREHLHLSCKNWNSKCFITHLTISRSCAQLDSQYYISILVYTYSKTVQCMNILRGIQGYNLRNTEKSYNVNILRNEIWSSQFFPQNKRLTVHYVVYQLCTNWRLYTIIWDERVII